MARSLVLCHRLCVCHQMAGVGRAASAQRRALSQGGALPDAKSLYRDLLRAVRAFPAEPMLDLNDAGTEQAFAVVATLQIRCARTNSALDWCLRPQEGTRAPG
jgi:hypothetical protein